MSFPVVSGVRGVSRGLRGARWSHPVANRPRAGAGTYLLLFSSLLSLSCQRKPEGTPPRYAVVRFENLSGDASLDWMSRAAAAYLSYTLAHALDGPVLDPESLARSALGVGPDPGAAPGISAQRMDAVIAGATRLLSGTVERTAAGIRLNASEEDLASHKTVLAVTAVAASPPAALARLAREISPKAAPYLTGDASVLRLYFAALDKKPADAVPDLQSVVGKAPDFGPAWVSLANTATLRHDTSQTVDLVAKAESHKLDPLDRAELDLLRTTASDDVNQRIDALRRISVLSPADTLLMRTLAQLETSKGRFADALADWTRLLRILPGDADALNQTGYTRAWNGDFTGALAAMKQYAQQRPADPNPLDSIGDVYYMYRKFADAATSYLGANAKDPRFQNGGDLYKAAWAQYEAGDIKKADATFAEFRAAREKAPAATPLIEGDWLYRTGRRKEGMQFLRKQTAAPNISAQLVIWDLLANDRAAGAKDAASLGQLSSAALLYAKFAALPSASAGEWRSRSERLINGPGVEPLRRTALGYALILDGKKDDARPVWEKIVAASPATDFLTRAILSRLRGEKPKFELLPDPNSFNQMRALAN